MNAPLSRNLSFSYGEKVSEGRMREGMTGNNLLILGQDQGEAYPPKSTINFPILCVKPLGSISSSPVHSMFGNLVNICL